MSTHTVTITASETRVTGDGRRMHRAFCTTCGWQGWEVVDSDNAERQRDRHHEQAEIDARTLAEAPPCTP